MTATAERPTIFPELQSAHPEPIGQWLGPRVRAAVALRWRGVAWLAPVLAIGIVVHAWGMFTFPRWVDDPGTYLSQAWAVAYEGTLSPYSYFYDHAPAGWIQIALWARLSNGFDRYDSAIAFGNECMLIAKIVSLVLVYWLARRLRFGRPAAAGAALLFALSPLALAFTRSTFLDNLVTPWILLSFALALSRRRTMIGAIGAGLAFGMAALTKETTLVLAPALLYLLIQNSDRRNRAHVLVMSLGLSALLMSSYVVYALAKGEFFAGPDHNSLLGTALWQLSGRESSGSLFDPTSSVAKAVQGWLTYDPWLLGGGLLAVLVIAFPWRLRPIALALLIEAAVVVRGGYVPAMQVVAFLPWCALAIPGAVEFLRGNPDLRIRRARPARVDVDAETVRIPLQRFRVDPSAPTEVLVLPRVRPRRAPRVRRRWLGRLVRPAVACLVLAALAVPAAPHWTASLVSMTTVTQPPELYQATGWIADNVPRDQVVVVHDAIWTDLVQHYGFAKDNVIMAYKLDADPAVHSRLTHLDYLVVPDWYYTAQNGKYPTLIEAQQHAVPAAHFGSGPDAVTVWHVSSRWRP